MNITEWAIKYNRVTLVVVLALVASGIQSYYELPKAQDPGFTIRTAVVTTRFPGASPERVEQLVTDAIEEKIMEMPEIDDITSESRSGISIINANFLESYTVMQPIFDDLRRKVEDITRDLPVGVETPIVNDEFGDTFGHVYNLTGDGYSAKEMRDIALDIRDQLLKEPNIAKVEIYGDQEERVFIEYDNARLTELGLSPQQLESILQSINILSSGGDIVIGSERIALEPSGNFESVDALKQTIIEIPGKTALVRLGDIAEVYRAYEDPVKVKVRANGEPAISISVSMREGGNIMGLGTRLKALMPEIEAELPLGISLTPMFLQSTLTEASVNTFISNLSQAVGIVILVMVLTLGFRTGLVVASLIPIVMVSTFFVMARFDIGIDQISLAALIIALGLLVDNAIVVVEAAIVRREQGEEPISAAIGAAKEMMVPLLVSSLTTAAAFTPIALAESAVSEFTSAIFYVVTIALLLSWALSMTFVPMMTPFVKVKSQADDGKKSTFETPLYRRYRGLLLASLRHPIHFGILVTALFTAAIYGMGYIPKVFIPPSEDPILSTALELPTGTTIDASEEMIEDLESFLLTKKVNADGKSLDAVGVTGWTAYIGTGGPRFTLGFDPPNPNEANTAMVLNVNNSTSLDPIKEAVEDYAFENELDMQLQVKRLSNGPPVSYPIEIKVSGPEFDELFQIVSAIKTKLWSYDAVTAINDTWGPQTKKLVINIDQARAFRSGVTSQDIATSLNAGLSGMEMTEYREGDEVIPVLLRTRATDRQDLAKLENLTVFSQSSGTVVPLSQVANVEVVWEPALIERLDRERTITIQGQLRPGVTAAEIATQYRPWLEEFAGTWSKGYRFEEGGETAKADEANASIIAVLPMAVIFIIMLLMIQFNSFRRTGIVLITIPLGLIGISFGLLAAQSSFGFFTFLGMVSLAGIVINNAIVLLDRIKLEMEENGLSAADAIVQSAQQRARPILLTTATTVGGMLPLWLSGGPMFESMAIAILFGLLFATLITLFLVPVLYSVLFRVSFENT
ncbi:MAG: efflux RND transporter permease subunit [Candidatus Thiodiazotropha sp. (ex Monitilora ramsayi)]|nr:efflux RND transporter permease subunit [Candidatus Thiodiazotropha sp. (ex Monitilora ramsayi)]